jgi:predicted O-linked N-acetylglucosamine transferase (SPINDLY family)
MTLQQQLQCGLSHHQAGRLAEAQKVYRQILAQQPEHAEALHLLGVLARQSGHSDAAVRLIRQAIRLKPDHAAAHGNLGNALKDLGQLDEAVVCYRQAIRLMPDHADAHCNLGNALKDLGQLDEAIASYRHAIRLKPDFAEAQNNLGSALKGMGRFEEAVAAYRHAIRLKPDLPEAHNNLGNALQGKGQLKEAIVSYRRAIGLKPDYTDAHYNLGIALKGIGQMEEAVTSLRQAIRLKPDFADAHYNLGNALRGPGQLDAAVTAYRHAIRIAPDYAKAHSNLGNVLKDKGQLDEAIACFRQAVRAQPDLAKAHSNLVLALLYHPGYDAKMIYEELRRWNQRHAEPLKKLIQPHPNDRDPTRQLRIGYISADFYDHVSAFFLLPLFRHHDRRQFEVFCYDAQGAHYDKVTRQMQDQVQHWRKIDKLTDTQVAGLVRQDQIDILVDLKLHTADNRLGVFAEKPAPVQATWLGYPGTTGLDAIDYRLTDPCLDPPGFDDACYSERSIHLSDTFWCYDPLTNEPAVNAPPCLETGFVTFGCLNNLCKVNEQVLQLWVRVLKTTDRSRLMMLCPKGSHRQPLLEMLQREGIQLDRIELVANLPRAQYLDLYHRIDVGLDTFPYNGHTTSLDSFWMGVPIITLVGQTVVGRAGVSQLTNLGLTELIAHTPDQYVQLAAALASDLPRLAELRRTLRQRMQASPLMDAPRFARNIETAYREMWRKWCQEGGNSNLQDPAR